MIVYPNEVELNITDSNCVAYTLDVKTVEPEESHTSFAKYLNLEHNQQDLFWYESILASVGQNKNDDVFLAEELWAARQTAVNKPVNYNHDDSIRLGHMVASIAVDSDGQVIDKMTNNFHVVTSSVLYKNWPDEENKALVASIIEEIPSGIWKVSMECRFREFDYGLSKGGENFVLARNEKTSFLTKKLRAFGGNGEYEGYKVSRILRNFYFSAKGLVKNPANPPSVITDYNTKAKISLNDIGTNMSESNNESFKVALSAIKESHAAELQAKDSQIAAITERIEAEAKRHNDEMAKVEAELSEYKEATAKYDEDKEKKEKDMEDSEAKVVELTNANEDLTKQVAEFETKVSELEKTIAEMSKAAKDAERMGKLTQANVEEAKAKELLEVWAEASDEQFDSIVEAYSKKESEGENKGIAGLNLDDATLEGEGQFSAPESFDDTGFASLLEDIQKTLK